ncbi:Atg16p NDAI_0H03160 [Naumovozyma dairenensis CBS 421]|uniref:Autophagy-related protein 16 domain-containing protein n=1 Tax=Naumovozyma dairenensis (strain ATCC 10597 / BCRC 20456 / CBS 421 / NBRC 0211 / NRRL Y-12639) TaxID=1071378 RepID=G0WFC8_NAUDC|nr:hypothetical protein NDAI_0H03160 [Naumovozyma dairenensis CBS 421]CCD26489.1 hypothetical protein NDAI_0H03160 [Naumovozyma dairenensis CBS 421]
MDEFFMEKLKERDVIESRFSELFQEVDGDALWKQQQNNVQTAGKDVTENNRLIISKLRDELMEKEVELKRLQEVINVQDKNNEKLNDELITVNIENNILQEKLSSLNKEHNKLVQRWLAKVQHEVDTMNAHFERDS